MEYPLFIPPLHLAKKNRRDWSKNEAEEYKDWMLGVSTQRAETLYKWLNTPPGQFSPEQHLRELGTKVANLLKSGPFSVRTSGSSSLSKYGYAIAADMGLVVAEYLFTVRPSDLEWKVVRRPRSDMSYNLPVIVGFGSVYLDPVGGSVAEAHAILRGERDSDIWEKIYSHWRVKS